MLEALTGPSFSTGPAFLGDYLLSVMHDDARHVVRDKSAFTIEAFVRRVEHDVHVNGLT